MPPTPREATPGEAGDITPAPVGDTPHGGDPDGGTGDTPPSGTPPTPKKEDGKPPELDPKKFVSKEEYEKAVKQRDRNYVRMKKAETKLHEKGIDDWDDEPAPPPNTPPQPTDPFSLAKQVGALRDFDEQELDFAAFIAQGRKISAADAVKTPEFETYLKGKRGVDYKRSTVPSPGSPASPPGAQLPDADKIGKMSKDEHMKLDQEAMRRQQGGSHGV